MNVTRVASGRTAPRSRVVLPEWVVEAAAGWAGSDRIWNRLALSGILVAVPTSRGRYRAALVDLTGSWRRC